LDPKRQEIPPENGMSLVNPELTPVNDGQTGMVREI